MGRCLKGVSRAPVTLPEELAGASWRSPVRASQVRVTVLWWLCSTGGSWSEARGRVGRATGPPAHDGRFRGSSRVQHVVANGLHQAVNSVHAAATWALTPQAEQSQRKASITAHTWSDTVLGSSCSQKRKTVHPASSKWRVVSTSRTAFRWSLASHQSELERGCVPCSGQPCQKQPSTNTATLTRVNAMSILRRAIPGTGKATRYRRPRA